MWIRKRKQRNSKMSGESRLDQMPRTFPGRALEAIHFRITHRMWGWIPWNSRCAVVLSSDSPMKYCGNWQTLKGIRSTVLQSASLDWAIEGIWGKRVRGPGIHDRIYRTLWVWRRTLGDVFPYYWRRTRLTLGYVASPWSTQRYSSTPRNPPKLAHRSRSYLNQSLTI